MSTTSTGGTPRPTTDREPAGAQARLAAAHNDPVGPADLTLPPAVRTSEDTAQVYAEVGREDAAHPGADEHTGPARPEQPSAQAVRNSSRFPLDRLGERWEQLKAVYETGRLGRVAAVPVRRFRDVIARTWGYWVILALVLAAGVTAELVYGFRAAALLTLADPYTALIGAVAFSLAMNGLAWYAAHLVFAGNQNVVRTAGARIALGAFLLIAVLVAVLGLVVGGFDPIQMSTVEGGGAATAATTGPQGRWTLALAYTLILLTVSAAIAAGHLLILDRTSELEVSLVLDADRRADRASLDPAQQRSLITSLGEAIIAAVPTAHRAGEQYTAVYNASFRHHAPVVVGEMFLDVDYDDSDPDWLPAVRDYLDRLAAQPAEKTASVTRIA